MSEFIERNIGAAILENAKLYPAVTIQGPRQCGKTTLLKNLFGNYSYADLSEPTPRLLASRDPYEFFRRYPEPVIIDEVQKYPEILSFVKARIDVNPRPGQYIISGSAQIRLREAVAESLAGRTSILTMYPLSLDELKRAGITLDRDTQLVSGFLPRIYTSPAIPSDDYYTDYIKTYIERDVYSENRIKDKLSFESFLQVLAGRVGQLADYSSIANDVGVSSTTISNWISILESSYIIYVLPPWKKNRTLRAVKTPKIYFTDTGLLSSLLGIMTPSQMLRDPLRGSIFENMAVMEAIKARTEKGERTPFYFFRSSRGLEVDLLLESAAEGLSLYEIKSASSADPSFSVSMNEFDQKNSVKIASKNIIYSGDDGALNGVNLINFHSLSEHIPHDEKFVLNLNR